MLTVKYQMRVNDANKKFHKFLLLSILLFAETVESIAGTIYFSRTVMPDINNYYCYKRDVYEYVDLSEY